MRLMSRWGDEWKIAERTNRRSIFYLDLRLGGGESECLTGAIEAHLAVGAVAEGLVVAKPATAKADGSASGEVEGVAFCVYDVELPFDTNGAVVENSYFS